MHSKPVLGREEVVRVLGAAGQLGHNRPVRLRQGKHRVRVQIKRHHKVVAAFAEQQQCAVCLVDVQSVRDFARVVITAQKVIGEDTALELCVQQIGNLGEILNLPHG